MNTEDLIGKKFGRLTAIKFDGIEHKRDNKGKNRDIGFWLCKCECGNLKRVARNALISGDTKSCGCLKKEGDVGKHLIDLTGKRFGKLVVLNLERKEIRKSENKRTRYFWRCKCECGKEIVVDGTHLREGNIRSCEDFIRNSTKTYTEIGNEFKRKNVLKEGTRLDNLSNKLSKANTSGVRGVSFKKDKNKYKATIGFKGETIFLGYYSNINDAKKAREQAEKLYYEPIKKKYGYVPKNNKIEKAEEFE